MTDFLLQVYKGIFGLMVSIIEIILLPLDSLLEQIIPDYASLSIYVSDLFDYVRTMILFVLDWVHIPVAVIDIVVGYLTFRVALYFGTFALKLFLNWYRNLKV